MLLSVDLFEVSLVLRGACPGAEVASVKSDLSQRLAGASGLRAAPGWRDDPEAALRQVKALRARIAAAMAEEASWQGRR